MDERIVLIDFLLDIYEEPKVWGKPPLQVRGDLHVDMFADWAAPKHKPVFDVIEDLLEEGPEVIAEEKRYAGDWRGQFMGKQVWAK